MWHLFVARFIQSICLCGICSWPGVFRVYVCLAFVRGQVYSEYMYVWHLFVARCIQSICLCGICSWPGVFRVYVCVAFIHSQVYSEYMSVWHLFIARCIQSICLCDICSWPGATVVWSDADNTVPGPHRLLPTQTSTSCPVSSPSSTCVWAARP